LYQKCTKNTTTAGKIYEEIACDYLKKNKYKIIEKNYRTRLGEIDIICSKKREIIFVEVKGGKSVPEPYLRVTLSKIKKLQLTMNHYLHHTTIEWEYIRLDVISITEPDKAIKHFKDILS
jgi:putative endonuclease